MANTINAKMKIINEHEHDVRYNHETIFKEMGFDMYYPPKEGKEFLGIDATWGRMFNQWVGQNGADYRLEAITVDGEKRLAVYATAERETEDEIYTWDFLPENIMLAYEFLIS